MIVHDCEQYSDEWWDLRRGMPTASRCDKIITPKTAKISAQSRQYMYELIAEMVSREEQDNFEPTDWMIRGLEMESEARDWYEMQFDCDLSQVGFITNDEGTFGCSPDCITDRGFEIKCPKGSTHVGYLLSGTLPDYYKPQIHASMYITGMPWTFISYHPDFEPLVVEVTPDDYTERVGDAMEQFVTQLQTAKNQVLKEAA